jgi:hypothetical protein
LLAVIGFPHRKNVAVGSARRPRHDHHPAFQRSGGDEAIFRVVEPHVLPGGDETGEYLSSIGEIEPALAQGLLSLGRVEGDIRDIM